MTLRAPPPSSAAQPGPDSRERMLVQANTTGGLSQSRGAAPGSAAPRKRGALLAGIAAIVALAGVGAFAWKTTGRGNAPLPAAAT